MGPAPGDKIWDWCTILQYFAEYLKRVLTLGPRYYRSSNFVLDFNMWETFESNLPLLKDNFLIFDTYSDDFDLKVVLNTYKDSFGTDWQLAKMTALLVGTRRELITNSAVFCFFGIRFFEDFWSHLDSLLVIKSRQPWSSSWIFHTSSNQNSSQKSNWLCLMKNRNYALY